MHHDVASPAHDPRQQVPSGSSRTKSPWVAAAAALVVVGVALGLSHRFTSHPSVARGASAGRTTPALVASRSTSTTTAHQSGPTGRAAPALPGSFSGSAIPAVHGGPAGRLDVIFTGAPYPQGAATIVPVEVLNATKHDVSHIVVSGPAISGATVVASGSSDYVQPALLAPGQVAFGIVAYYAHALPGGTTFDMSASGSKGASSAANLKVVRAAYASSAPMGPSVVGTVTNTDSHAVKEPIETDLYCFGTNGALLSVSSGFVAGHKDLAPGAVGSYAIAVRGPAACTGDFLVGSSGFTS